MSDWAEFDPETGNYAFSEDSSNEAAIPAQTPAGYDKRVLGAITDRVIFYPPLIVILFPFSPVPVGLLVPVLFFGVWLFGYRQGVTGKTPGKRVAGTRLTRIGTGEAPGGAVGMLRLLVPNLIVVVTGGFGAVYVIIDYLWLLWDDDNQRLTDKMFKTQVVVSTH
ncbi:MAG: RDD family protein [Gemmatimonadota bacterium]|nr:RDD family protein [Gemmatimonadota bacterium]